MSNVMSELITVPGYLSRVDDLDDNLDCVVIVRDSSDILKEYVESVNKWVDENIPNVRKILFNPNGPSGRHTSVADLVVQKETGRRWLVESTGLRITTVGKALNVSGLLVESHDKRVLIDGDPDDVDGSLDAWLVTKDFGGERKRKDIEACGACPVHYGKGSTGGLTILPHGDGAWYEVTASEKNVVWAPGDEPPKYGEADLVFGGWDEVNKSFYQIGLSRIERIALAKSGDQIAISGMVFMPMTEGLAAVRKFGRQITDPAVDPSPAGGPSWDQDDPEIDYRTATKAQLEAAIDCGTCVNFVANTDKDGVVGSCTIIKGVISAGNVCNFWESITSDFGARNFAYAVNKAVGAKQYTFGVVYKATNSKKDPEFDAHEEFVTADVLQSGQWEYVQGGDRKIHLQHDMMGMIEVGEWVDIVTWPDEVTMELSLPNGEMKKSTIPANSVWMGVLWNDAGWRLVKSGQIRGLSMGGMARRRNVRAKR